MFKRIVAAILSVGALALAAPAFAAGPTSTQIACVGAAVNARETAIGSAISAYTQAIASAYSARATALQKAYAQTPGNDAIRNAVKAAWSAFNASTKDARKGWQSSRNTAWSQFRSAVKACKAPAVANDSSSASSEASGQ